MTIKRRTGGVGTIGNGAGGVGIRAALCVVMLLGGGRRLSEAAEPIASEKCDENETRAEAPAAPRLSASNGSFDLKRDGRGAVWLVSADDGLAGWLAVPVGSLNLRMTSGVTATAWLLYVDGQPHGALLSGGRTKMETPDLDLGRHVIQARYRAENGGWSRISSPLRVDLVSLPAPRIEAVFGDGQSAAPVSRGEIATIQSATMFVRVANIASKTTRVSFEIDGRAVPTEQVSQVGAALVFKIDLNRLGPPGEYSIRARAAETDSAGARAGAESPPIAFRWQGEVTAKAGGAPTESPKSESGGAAAKLAAGSPSITAEFIWQTATMMFESARHHREAVDAKAAHEPLAVAKAQLEHGTKLANEQTGRMGIASANQLRQIELQQRQARWNSLLQRRRDLGAWGVLLDLVDPLTVEVPRSECAVDDGQARTFHYSFETPAHFARREFSRRGEPMEREALVIYEGMTLEVSEKGSYKVEFRTNSPSVPVTLDLQLQLRIAGEWKTLSLPRVVVEPSAKRGVEFPSEEVVSTGGETQGRSKAVTLKGNLPANWKTILSGDLEIRRLGAARFGYSRAEPQ